MLRISKLADYGTVVMVYLAKCEAPLCNARDIAFHTRLTLPTVSKLLKRLTLAGLLVSVRGVSGGYRLQREAKAISVAEIIAAVDAYRGLTECSHQSSDCVLQDVCHVQRSWQIISRTIETILEQISLEALVSRDLAGVDFSIPITLG